MDKPAWKHISEDAKDLIKKLLVADPSKRIICIIGDGGFNMNPQELQTIKNYGCKIKTIILNNTEKIFINKKN